jgi:hypothetical protein
MSNTEIEVNNLTTEFNNEIIDNTSKRGKGRPVKDPSAPIPYTKTKEYFKEYYKKSMVKINCEKCGVETNKFNLLSHQRSMKCKYTYLLNVPK